MDKTTISYDRQGRKWLLLGEIGEILAEFPPGAEGQHQAVIAQLEIEAPEALSLARDIEARIPSLNGRAIRAAQLVATDSILEGGHANRWRVRSQNSRNLYTVHVLRDGRWHCHCSDWQRGEAGASNGAPWLKNGGVASPCCKHILAVRIARKVERQAEVEAARQAVEAYEAEDKPGHGYGGAAWWLGYTYHKQRLEAAQMAEVHR